MGPVDIVKNYYWTTIPKGAPWRERAPYVKVDAFEIKMNQLFQSAANYVNIFAEGFGQTGTAFYDNLYRVKKVRTFKFPFFDDKVRSFSNTFGDSFSGGMETGGSAIGSQTIGTINDALKDLTTLTGQVKALKNNTPGSYIETPKFYQYESGGESLDVSFPLINTVDDSSSEEMNYLFVKEFTKMNRPKRINAFEMTAPCIYSVHVPGQRFIRWAYCQAFNVGFEGSRTIRNGRVTPEAYQVSMTFTSLTCEVSNFMDKV